MIERKSEDSRGSGSLKEPRRAGSGADAEIGDALRSAYQQTLSEDVPTDLMDLLNRLD